MDVRQYSYLMSLTMVNTNWEQEIQSALTLNSIRFLMCAIPAVSMLVAYVVYKKAYHLDDSFMKKVIQTIEERRANRNAEQY